MEFQTRLKFIDFKSRSWYQTIEIIESINELNFESFGNMIQNLQTNNWGQSNHAGLNILSDDYKEKLIKIFAQLKPMILNLSSEYETDISVLYPRPFISIQKTKCIPLLAALVFCCSQAPHTFFNERDHNKLLCIISYFSIILKKPWKVLENEFLTIERKILNPVLEFNDWVCDESFLLDYEIDTCEKIEDYPYPSLKVDFANSYIGGGVLDYGCVQEEILFSIYPEMILSMVLCERMDKNEAITITGPIRSANYVGYGWGFTFKEEFNEDNKEIMKNDEKIKENDKKLNENLNQRQYIHQNMFVAMDALMIFNFYEQFTSVSITRELNKAFIGFSRNSNETSEDLVPVVTGKWGCGEFGGFAPLKILLQWIAASKAGRKIVITTFHDPILLDLEQVMHKFKNCSIKDLLSRILEAADFDLFNILLEKHPKVQKESITLNLPTKTDKSKW